MYRRQRTEVFEKNVAIENMSIKQLTIICKQYNQEKRRWQNAKQKSIINAGTNKNDDDDVVVVAL